MKSVNDFQLCVWQLPDEIWRMEIRNNQGHAILSKSLNFETAAVGLFQMFVDVLKKEGLEKLKRGPLV